MSTQEITRKTCDQCKKIEESDKEMSFGGPSPFAGWVAIQFQVMGCRRVTKKDFCSFECLHDYIEGTKQ